ncbi:MAG TPA: malto-oligosyltrehalose synthase [Planctomycetota bacterium]
MNAPTAPGATYRLQLNAGFPLDRVGGLLDYFRDLGVSHLYLSPVTRARAGSAHGYDVVDPGVFNPEIGTEEALVKVAAALRERGMGILLDVVPNHMCVGDPANTWWLDVLENGPSSPYAPFFDVDWDPPKSDLKDKVLLPVLGDQYGKVIESQEIQVLFEGGAFWVKVYGTPLPLGPRTWGHLLLPALGRLVGLFGDGHADLTEFESILTALRNLPTRAETAPDKVRERQREKEVIKQRLAALAARSEPVNAAILASVTDLNGVKGAPRSFDRLEALLAEQGFRLSHWRVASDEINYRRFFDINELAAVRVEEPRVFDALHGLVRRLVEAGAVDGLRVDHVDGLFDPLGYLEALRRLGESAGRRLYLVVEKILTRDERLAKDWPVEGTTGYGFLNLLNGLFIDTTAAGAFRRRTRKLTEREEKPEDVLYEARKLILLVSMSGELTMLARRLDRLSEQHRYSRDFTLNSLQQALAEVMACFPVYRTYTRPGTAAVSASDRRHVAHAIKEAKRRNPAVSPSVFDFIAGILLLEPFDGLSPADVDARRDWVLRFQQMTSPVMAKGLEDTAFYRHVELASINEVGGDLTRFGTTLEEFHLRGRERAELRPHALSATATHDTKRGEDTRARLDVLSEMPDAWFAALERWREKNAKARGESDGEPAPDAAEELFLYQTLLGTWPGTPDAAYGERLRAYVVKALREAKLHSSWVSPVKAYEDLVTGFLDKILADASFVEDLAAFAAPVIRSGALNSLAQTLIKIASPGVPDFYQGTELWDLSLVDPDNRRPVDFETRVRALRELASASPADLLANAEDGRIKLWVTSRALDLRRRRPAPFRSGDYEGLSALGPKLRRVVAFSRRSGDEAVVALTGRFFSGLLAEAPWAAGAAVWGGTRVTLPEALRGRRWRDVLSGRELADSSEGLDLGQVFETLPLALLEPC